MNANLIRSLTVFSLSTLSTFLPAGAGDFGADQFGAAPASLDFPREEFGASDADLRKAATLDQKKNEMREELSLLSAIDPFPSGAIAPVDPLSRKKVGHVLVGPAFKARGYGADYDYYRYVTFYDVSVRKERIYALPIQRAECYDKGDIFSSYNYSISYSASVTASASIKGLGLSATLGRSRTFTASRGVSASGGVVADYTPMALKQDWNGRTFIQVLASKTGKVAFLDRPSEESPWWVFLLFPNAAKEKYPMPFAVKDADWTFAIERKILSTCDGDFGAR